MASPKITCAPVVVKKFRSDSMTALLRPVVPEVNISTIRSSGFRVLVSPWAGALSRKASMGRRRPP